ncbi:MAG: ACT domain-containing protein [Oscillospiraceae bacterium]|jgi:ACT domain-containing protein|nr:ACT domain-containing protein [Oscillospiraceae bacterium]
MEDKIINETGAVYRVNRRRGTTAVVTVLGRDQKGIIAKTSGALFECNVNVLDLSQTVLDDVFNMVMLVDISDADFNEVQRRMSELGESMGQQIRIQRGEIFDAMHRV